MKTYVVNLAYLDPTRVGGVGRVAYEVSRLLADCADASPSLRVIFVVGWRFAGMFADWLGRPAAVVPFITRHDLRLTMRLLKPDAIISPLFGLQPFADYRAIHITGMPDALALDHPELFPAEDLAYRQQVYDQLPRAAQVVTLSEHARERLRYHIALRPDQISVVPLGAELQITHQGAATPDLPQRYLFYPANMWPHKRHELLLSIMQRIWERQPDLHLVLTGGRSDADRQHLQELMRQYGGSRERIHDLGYVDDAQLVALYRKAEALLFVSQYEGFGMPLLEAMQQGCPVICAPLAAIPEVVGDAGIYVNSSDPDEWVQAVLETLPRERSQFITAGRAHAAQFTWAKSRSGWRSALHTAGLECPDSAGQSSNHAAEITKQIHPLLKQISTLASTTAHSRLRKLIHLPRIGLLQLRILNLARRYKPH